MAIDRMILNFDRLASTNARRHALEIAERGFQSIAIGPVFSRELKLQGSALTVHQHSYDLDKFKRIFVIGAGKGSSQAAAAVEQTLGDRITAGAVNDVVVAEGLSRVTGFAGTHPLPSKQNVAATDRMLELAQAAGEDDLVITIICGGGSALFTRPAEGVSVEKLVEVRLHMLKSGAPIEHINTVYKHLSDVHGGKLAAAAFPATVLTLAVSDIPNDDPYVIASGPTLFDKTTVHEAKTIAAKYGLTELPLVETPNENDFSGNHGYAVLASADLAVQAMADEAERLGYRVSIAGTSITSPADEVGESLAKAVKPGEVIIFAGEPPVVVKNPDGKGGRMQHTAVSALPYLAPDTVAACCASDGSDFINGVAGAIVDGSRSLQECKERKLDLQEARDQNNSYPLLKELDDLLFIKPGITANVSDFGLFLRAR